MSWGAQNRSKDAKTPSVAGVRSDKPELDCCPIQPYCTGSCTGSCTGPAGGEIFLRAIAIGRVLTTVPFLLVSSILVFLEVIP
jgi:hypothetical protein